MCCDLPVGMVSGYCGTPCYMAPEQLLPYIRDQQSPSSISFDGRAADVWAAGTVAFEVLTGCKPFPVLMSQQQYEAELARPKQARMQRLAQAYEAWEVSRTLLHTAACQRVCIQCRCYFKCLSASQDATARPPVQHYSCLWCLMCLASSLCLASLPSG